MLGKLQQLKIDHYFDMIDRNDDGFITEEDFGGYVARFAELKGQAQDSAAYERFHADTMGWWNSMREAVDQDGDSRLTRDEWQAFWTGLLDAVVDEAIAGGSSLLDQLKQTAVTEASLMDADGDGRISPEEYGLEFQAWNCPIDYDASFKRLDLNGDGYLTVDELTVLFKEFMLSNDPEAPGNHLFGPVF